MRSPVHLVGILVGGILGLALLFLSSASCTVLQAPDDPLAGRPGDPRDASEVAALGDYVTALLGEGSVTGPVPSLLRGGPGAVYIGLRKGGLKLAGSWATAAKRSSALKRAAAEAKRRLGENDHADAAEVVVALAFETIAYRERKRYLANIHRGVYGLEIRHGEEVASFAPTEMIATNRSFETLIRRFAEARGLDERQSASALALRRFSARQFLVPLEPGAKTVEMFRGNRLVPLAAVTRESTGALMERMSAWMIRNVHPDGRMTYKYWPSRGRESDANNMIRQWMASLCLVRLARHRDEGALDGALDGALLALAARNIRYNLDSFYREEDGLGIVEYRGKAKLGAIALAALTLAEFPDKSLFPGYQTALRRSIDQLWHDDGSFTSFLRPVGRNDNQNFYPGEALVYLARRYRDTEDAGLLARIRRSVGYYRDWHRANRNPAFVPWHTMAYALVWEATGDPALGAWILEMNDWLLAQQQSAPSHAPDIDGRFYDPKRPEFGPPHASSTGTYLEGLIQAFRVARALGDQARAEAYRKAILRGLRSVMQLAFADPVDMFYIAKRDRVEGAPRTTVYDNEIRVDNVQHTLMAVLEILAAFEERDFRS